MEQEYAAVFARHQRRLLRVATLVAGDVEGRGDGGIELLAERDRVWRALESLPVGQRTVVVLRFYEDLREADIADAMGIPVGTVKSNLSRALEKLRGELLERVEHG
jgi:RNA polymerase sigma factor (sigma-70 family)